MWFDTLKKKRFDFENTPILRRPNKWDEFAKPVPSYAKGFEDRLMKLSDEIRLYKRLNSEIPAKYKDEDFFLDVYYGEFTQDDLDRIFILRWAKSYAKNYLDKKRDIEYWEDIVEEKRPIVTGKKTGKYSEYVLSEARRLFEYGKTRIKLNRKIMAQLVPLMEHYLGFNYYDFIKARSKSNKSVSLLPNENYLSIIDRDWLKSLTDEIELNAIHQKLMTGMSNPYKRELVRERRRKRMMSPAQKKKEQEAEMQRRKKLEQQRMRQVATRQSPRKKGQRQPKQARQKRGRKSASERAEQKRAAEARKREEIERTKRATEAMRRARRLDELDRERRR
jgi:hypothetical protein